MVMTETTSNLHHPVFISSIDRVITPFTSKNFLAFQPEIVVTFGGMVVSKRIKTFLRRFKPEHHWHIDPLRAYDTFGSLTKHFDANPNDFLTQFLPFTKKILSDYRKDFTKINFSRAKKHNEFFSKAPFSDFKAYGTIIPQLPAGSQVHIGNSAAIRYAQLFDPNPEVEVYCNRGTSGIDGSTSTAIGAAIVNGKPTILITGDVGFLYDSNALWNEYIPKDFKIIVVNNGGGGIFRILPGHQENKIFNKFFETSHCLTAEHFAKMYGFEYFTARDEETLDTASKAFYSASKPAMLEIFTPTRQNDKVLHDYFKSLA
jgi:2-succinyl-5-enolpyruvyl-6-hydroxy-3-cyclohexene-1-carboxylate synthase